MNILQFKDRFNKEYGSNNKQSIHCFFSPGRVNLIGEHIDYNGGYVFPAALSLGIYGALRFRSDNLIQLKSTNASTSVSIDLKELIVFKQEERWANYPKGVIKQLLDKGYLLKGCDILVSGNLPDGAGLSSSAALLVLITFMLRYACGETTIDKVELAKFCQQVENQFMGVNCGIMDQFSVAMGRQDHAILLDCDTLQYKYIPFVLGVYSLVIMNTNKKRELAESKYNQRRCECEAVLRMIREHRQVASLCQVSFEDVEKYVKDDVLQRRARHVISENQRVLLAVELLGQGDIAGFANLMIQSHLSLKDDYEVTGLELDAMVECALKGAGCIGARMTGAGFGGCAIALVATDQLELFTVSVSKNYEQKTGLKPDFYVANISDGVKAVD
ncbi:galactokinase [Pelosinus propionicus]|uniref:Galactokinase n=1 Tax=Pelosinus propionicus DSM 13327 TaxID=1123291 RepID=A0A1I4GPZ0_9FIRM|nr:galactokinase [Pelosinus propionicus]SFL31231.1 galactokinase [Pelosinus propionicus DSM 13327]